MTIENQPELIETQMQPVRTGKYTHPAHSFRYSPRLTGTRQNYYDSKEQIPEGYRMSTAAEELAIQLGLERADQDPRKSPMFDILFGFHYMSPTVGSLWQWTGTGLRVPNGWENGRHQKDAKGNKQYPRIVLIGDQEVGEATVPGDGECVVEWNEVFGIPSLTISEYDATDPKKRIRYFYFNIDSNVNERIVRNHTTHFYFNPNPNVDERTGRQDVAVGRGSIWRIGDHDGCLAVRAYYNRWYETSNNSFRLVQGSVPATEKSVAIRGD